MNGHWEDDETFTDGVASDGIATNILGIRDRFRRASGQSQKGSTPEMSTMSRKQSQDLVRTLSGLSWSELSQRLDSFDDLNGATMDTGNTLLHTASTTDTGNKVVQMLLQKDANHMAENNSKCLPVHLAVQKDNYDIVKMLVEHDKSVVDKAHSKTGLKLVHMAALCKSWQTVKYLVTNFPDSVSTFPSDNSPYAHLSVLHIVGKTFVKEMEDLDTEVDRDSRGIDNMFYWHDLMDSFLQVCKPHVYVTSQGSALNYLIKMNHKKGVRVMLEKYKSAYPQQLESFVKQKMDGKTPLVAAATNNVAGFEIAKILLQFGADPNDEYRGEPVTSLAMRTPTEPRDASLILDDLLTRGAALIPAIECCIDVANIALLKILVEHAKIRGESPGYVVNHVDPDTGQTFLHSCLESTIDNDSVEDNLVYLLSQGADLCLAKTVPRFGPILPVHLAVKLQSAKYCIHNEYFGQNRLKEFFNALSKSGLDRIISQLQDNEKVQFLREHCLPAAYVVDHEAVRCMLVADNGENDLVHYKKRYFPYDQDSTVYKKPLLHWATEHNHPPLMYHVVQAEYQAHKSKKDGLECFQMLSSNNALKQTAVDFYFDLWEPKAAARARHAIPTFIEVVLLCYLLFGVDLYWDIDLIHSYGHLSSYKIGELTLRNFDDYAIAFILSIVLVIPSFITYFYVTWAHSPVPCLKYVPRPVVKLFMPFVYLVSFFMRTLRSKMHPNEVEWRKKVAKDKSAWASIRRVEIGIEACGQLVLQLWLLVPFMEEMSMWSAQETFAHTWTGLGYFLSMRTMEATFLERMVAKYMVSSVIICMGVTLIRSGNKCSWAGSFCMFLSCCCQMAARTMALKLLFLSHFARYEQLSFLILHWIICLAIKVTFEVPPMTSRSGTCSKVRDILLTSLNVLTSSCCCMLVYINMERSEASEFYNKPNIRNTLLPTASHFLLILLEQVILIVVTALNPPLNFTTNHMTVYWTVPVILILASASAHIFYYTCLHPASRTGAVGPNLTRGNQLKYLICCQERVFTLPNCCSMPEDVSREDPEQTIPMVIQLDNGICNQTQYTNNDESQISKLL